MYKHKSKGSRVSSLTPNGFAAFGKVPPPMMKPNNFPNKPRQVAYLSPHNDEAFNKRLGVSNILRSTSYVQIWLLIYRNVWDLTMTACSLCVAKFVFFCCISKSAAFKLVNQVNRFVS